MLKLERFDALISDLRMPGLSGLAFLETARIKCPWMSLLIAIGVDNVRIGVDALKQGADDYILKLFRLKTVVPVVERALKKKRLQLEVEANRKRLDEMKEEQTGQLPPSPEAIHQDSDETVRALGAALAWRHMETERHSCRVTRYCREIAKTMGCSPEQMQQVERGAYLHDIGKTGIPDPILLKPDKLTPAEVAVMQTHTRLGYELVGQIPFLKPAAEIVLVHHERFDGTGYPQGLKGDEIPLGARIVAVAEAFDVMVGDQPYRSARTFDDALAEMRRCSGTQFDPMIVTAFFNWCEIHGDPRKQR
jgi:putative nucleotidyltransferase with HDIG domain